MGISRDSRHKRRLTGGRRNIHQKKRKYELGRQSAQTKIGSKRVIPIRVRGGNKKYRALRLDTGNFSWGSECCTRRTRVLDVVYNASNNELVRTKTLEKNAIIQIDATPFRQWYEQYYGVTIGKKKLESKDAAGKDKKDAGKDKDKKDAGKDKKGDKDKDKKGDKDKDKKGDKDKKPEDKDKKTEGDKDKKAEGDKKQEKEKEKKKSKSVKMKMAHRQKTRVLDPQLAEQFHSGRLYACIASRPGQVGRCDGYIVEGKELEFYLRKIQKKK